MGRVTCGMIVIFVLVVFALARHALPPDARRAMTAGEARAVGRAYRWVGVAGVVLFFAVLASAFVGLSAGLARLHGSWLTILPASRFILPSRPSWVLWAAPSLVLALVLPWPVLILFNRAVLGRARYQEYRLTETVKLGFDRSRLLLYSFALVAPLTAAACALLMNWYERFDEQGIVVNSPVGPGERLHSYRDIARVVRLGPPPGPDGEVAPNPSYCILFQDGYLWTSSDLPNPEGGPGPRGSYAPMIEFVCQRTGRTVENAASLREVTGK